MVSPRKGTAKGARKADDPSTPHRYTRRMPSKPQIHEPPTRPAWFLYAVGLGLMTANKVRRFFRPYDRPRPWSAKQVDRSVRYVHDVVRNWEIGFGEAGIEDWVRGRSVLEMGPGPDLGTGLILIARGAKSYLAVDRFPLIGSTPELFYEKLQESIADQPDAARARAAYERFRDGDNEGDLRYALVPDDPEGAATPTVPPPDLWLSQAALEHVEDPPTPLRLMTGWCAPGALALHHVDAATHTPWIREADPLNILRYRDGLYRGLSFPGSPNRWRSSRFIDSFRGLGWDVLDNQQVHRLSESALARSRDGLVEPFRSLPADELACFSFRLVLRKG